MSINLQPPVPLVTLVKTEPPTVIKNEPPVGALEEEISTDIKDIDIVYHPLSEDLIKSETVLEDILENKHLKSMQTQALAKTENSPFIKTENITQRNESEHTSDGNVSEGTAQGAVKVQASNEHSNALCNLETDKQSVLNFSKTLNGISVRSRKSKSHKKTDFAECYKTDDTTLWEKEKIKVIKAPMIPVEAHEYTSLAKDRHVCNHCQQTCKKMKYLKDHIRTKHRNVTTMYQCPYCPYKSKWSLQVHIIRKHKNIKDIQWFQCHLCEKKFKLKSDLTRHKKVHLTHEQMKDGLDLREKRYHCDTCDYKTYTNSYLKNHKIIHLKPEEIEYFYCYHCTYKNKHKQDLKKHIFRQHFKNVKQEKSFRHHCDKCNYKTYASTALKNHKLTHLKPEEIQYFYCYHCSYKAKWKGPLKEHIFKHFKNEQISFHCYICDFVSLKRDLIIEHIRKHFKNRNKYDETIRKYQLESHINNLKKRCPNNLEDHCSTVHFDDLVNHIKKQKSEQQPESTLSFVSRTVSVPENLSKSCIFQCTYCPTKFPQEHLLKGHLQLHSSIRGIECPICTYKHNKTEILKHLSWHGANGNDSFKCPICDLKKRTKENMDDHLKVVHSKAIYQKHDSVCKNKTCNGFCQITIGGDVGAE